MAQSVNTFNSYTFLNAQSKNELIILLVATGLCVNRYHAQNWINSKMGGYGDFDKAKRRAAGYYLTKYKINQAA